MNKKLVLVADGCRAQILSAKGRKLHNVIQEFENKELDSHDTIRRKDAKSQNGHFYDPHQSLKELEKDSFAKNLIQEVTHQMLQDQYESIILVASPQMLGMLRKKLNSNISVDRSLCLEATRMELQDLEDKIFS